MSMRTGPTNPETSKLIVELKTLAIQKNIPLWKRIATELESPRRNRRAVNLSRINRYSEENEFIIVPGKVLGSGELDHKITIAAYAFSSSALEKLEISKCKALSIRDILKEDVKGKKIRIMG